MDWAEEIKMSFRKTATRKGRRAKSRDELKDSTIPSTTSTSPSSKLTADNLVNKNSNYGVMLDMPESSNTDTSPSASVTSPRTSNITKDSGGRAPRPRIPGGWADNTSIRIINSKKDYIDDDERFNISTGSKVATSSILEDDIPVIPDLDDVKDEVLMNEIVEPPNISENRVIMLKELNLDLLSQSAFSAIEDIDLSLLMRCLQAQDALDEPDEVWEWDKLFAEVIAEIHSDTLMARSDGIHT